MSAGSGNPPAGWYPEPGSGRQRWWDGSSWGDYAPSSLPPVGGAPYGGAPYGGAPYGGAPYGGGPPLGGAPVGGYPVAGGSAGTNGFAIASLVLGILGLLGFFFFGWILSIPAIIFGAVSLKQIPQRDQQGKGMAIAGLILGILGLIVGIIIIVTAATIISHLSTTTSSSY